MPPLEFHLVEGSLESPPPPLKIAGYGAIVEFLGVVRPEEAGRPIVALDYEAYREMAVPQGLAVLRQVASLHPILGIQVFHRVGRVLAGEISLRARVHAKHRHEAFAACEDFIVRLKKDVPIWKHPVA